MNDIDVIKKLIEGDEETFQVVVGKYQKIVLNCCYKFVRNKETAEDLTQEVFIQVFESIKTFRSDSKLSTWIYRITITKSLNHLKSLKRKKRFGKIFRLFGEDELEKKIKASDNVNPFVKLENEDRARILQSALEKLPENQRIAFTLSKSDEMSYNEIADILNTSISSVESLIHRAKKNLKKRLFHYYKNYL